MINLPKIIRDLNSRIAELEALCKECADYLDTNTFTSIHNDSYLHRSLRSNAPKDQGDE